MIDLNMGRQNGKSTLDYYRLKIVAQLENNFEKMLFMAGLELDYAEGLENSIERINKIKKFKEDNDIKIRVETSSSKLDIYTMSKNGVDVATFGVKKDFNFGLCKFKLSISEVKKL